MKSFCKDLNHAKLKNLNILYLPKKNMRFLRTCPKRCLICEKIDRYYLGKTKSGGYLETKKWWDFCLRSRDSNTHEKKCISTATYSAPINGFWWCLGKASYRMYVSFLSKKRKKKKEKNKKQKEEEDGIWILSISLWNGESPVKS